MNGCFCPDLKGQKRRIWHLSPIISPQARELLDCRWVGWTATRVNTTAHTIRLSHCSMARLDLESSQKMPENRYFLLHTMAQQAAVFRCQSGHMARVSWPYTIQRYSQYESGCTRVSAVASQSQVIFCLKQSNQLCSFDAFNSNRWRALSFYRCILWSLGHLYMPSSLFQKLLFLCWSV